MRRTEDGKIKWKKTNTETFENRRQFLRRGPVVDKYFLILKIPAMKEAKKNENVERVEEDPAHHIARERCHTTII